MSTQEQSGRVVVLVSGRGSNLEALLHAQSRGALGATVVAVGSDRQSASGLVHAEAAGIHTFVVRPRDHEDRARWDAALAEAISSHNPDLVVLAGFMKIVGPAVLQRCRAVNVHPALLPSFPGLEAPKQAIDAGVRIAGCTVHWVDDGVDTGPILAQAAVPVWPSDDAASLHRRIQAAEHRLLPSVVRRLVGGGTSMEAVEVPAMVVPPIAAEGQGPEEGR